MTQAVNSDVEQLISQWLASPRSDETNLRDLDEKYYDAISADVSTKAKQAWYAQDPGIRSLAPPDVPSEVRSRLDVRGVELRLTGLPDNAIVWTSSASGVSQGVRASNLPTLIPAYFLPADETILVEWSTDASRFDVRTIAELKVAFDGSLGYEVSNSIEHPNIRLLTPNELVELMSLTSVAELEALRASMLNAQVVGD